VNASESRTRGERPLVTFAIITFNQEKHIRQAIEAAFAQTYSPLVIAVSDDASSDSTFDIVVEMCSAYRGPHGIRYSRNERNLGLIGHINRVNETAEGELIVIGAGDDISVPQRVGRLVDAYIAAAGRSHYFFSLVRAITNDGELQGVYQSPGMGAAASVLRAGLSNYPISIGAAQAWTRRLARSFPPMRLDLWAEDQILGFRGRLLGPVVFKDEALVYYRSSEGVSNMEWKFDFGTYVRNQIRLLAMYQQRTADALSARQRALGTVIALKRAALIVFFPLSPFFSLLRRWQRVRGRRYPAQAPAPTSRRNST